MGRLDPRTDARRSGAWSGLLLLLVCSPLLLPWTCSGGGSRVQGDLPEPPPSEAPWPELAAWAAEGYRALGFPVPPGPVPLRVEPESDRSQLLDAAAQDFADEVRAVTPSQNADTRWMIKRALGHRAAASPADQLEADAQALIGSTPLWFDRRSGTICVLAHHPFFDGSHGDRGEAEPWHLMAHEVAHLLQDRRHPLRQLCSGATYEEQLVKKCLMEGEAELRSLALMLGMRGESLLEADPAACQAELRRLYARGAPSFYDAGFRYLLGVLQDEGWEAVELALLDPAVSSRDLLSTDPGDILPVLEVVLPAWPEPAAIEAQWEDVVGAWGLLTLLGSDYPDPLRSGDLIDVALAWRGDRLAVMRRPDGVTALMWRLVFDDEQACARAAEFFAGSEGTVARHGPVLDFVWSPVPALERRLLERLGS